MHTTIREAAHKPHAAPIPDFGDFVAQERAKEASSRTATGNPPPQEDAGEMVARLVEENRPKRKTVTAKQYQQATKLQVGSEVFHMGLTPTELVVWMYLVRCSDRDGKSFPSITTICDNCQCRRSTAVKAIRALERKMIVTSHHRFHKPTVYMLRPPQDWSSLTVE